MSHDSPRALAGQIALGGSNATTTTRRSQDWRLLIDLRTIAAVCGPNAPAGRQATSEVPIVSLELVQRLGTGAAELARPPDDSRPAPNWPGSGAQFHSAAAR